VTNVQTTLFNLESVTSVNGNAGSTTIKDVFPTAARATTLKEGEPSKTHRYWGWMIQASNFDFLGFACYDMETGNLTTIDVSTYGALAPNNVSISPLGGYLVTSGALSQGGTRAYVRDFSSYVQLHTNVEHSDIGIGPNGTDEVYIFINFSSNAGTVDMHNITTDTKTPLTHIYHNASAGDDNTGALAYHFSCRCFEKPGYFVLSTTRNGDLGKWAEDKILICEMADNGRVLNVSNTYNNYSGYWTAPRATINRDGTKILFSTGWLNASTEADAVTYEIAL
jgi:hypothetical protein